MELIPIECGNCKAKLKIKAMPARMPTEVKCPKCGKPIPVGKGAPASPATVPSPALVQPVAAPVPPIPVAPAPVVAKPAPPAPPPAPAPAPASSTAQLTPPSKPIQPVSGTQPGATPKKAAAPIVLGQVTEPASVPTITAVCPTCQWQTKVAQALIGKKIKCKQCSGIVPVAGPEPVTPVVPTAVPPPAPPRVEPTELEIVTSTPPSAMPVAPVETPPVPRQPQPPTPPIAQWTPLEPTLADPLSSTRNSPGITVLVGEIATLKSKLEAAVRDSTLSSRRLDEAEKKAQQAEARAKDAEEALHEQVGKAAIDAVTAQRRIEELTAHVAALSQTLARTRNAMAGAQATLAAELHLVQNSGVAP